MKKMRKNQKGFTLVELVVVIAVLGILAAIAIPNLIGFQDRAKQQADKQVAAQLKTSIALLYANGEVGVTSGGSANFKVTAVTQGTPVVTLGSGGLLDKNGASLTKPALEALIKQLVSDIHTQSGRPIKVTITSGGSVTSVLD